MKQQPLFLSRILLLLIALTGLACVIPGFGRSTPASFAGSVPLVTVSSPAAGQKLAPAQEVKVQSMAVDADKGIVRVELLVNNQVIWVDANPNPQPATPYLVAQPWTPETPGSHVLQVRAYNVDNRMGQSEPVTFDVLAQAQTLADTPPVQTEAPPPTPTAASLSGASMPPATPTPVDPLAPTTPAPLCTPPPCRLDAGEVYFCPDDCSGGCGTTCATVTPIPIPTTTPTPGSFRATGRQPEGRFKDIWQGVGGGTSRLGYPTGPEIGDRNFARQYFERGLMFWWDNPEEGADFIWVIDSPAEDLKSGTTSNRYMDTWAGGDEFSCAPARANGSLGPIRGFGRVWCQHPALQTRLGNPRDYEGGSGGNPPFAGVQFFQGGVMIYNPLDAEVYVLFDQGDWQRMKY